MAEVKTQEELDLEKYNRTMQVVARQAGYYRANPQRFAEEFLCVNLKLFQKILLWAMMRYDFFMYIAARSQGKTWLTAIFATIRCILYPGTKVIVASGTLKQANEVLLKVQDDLMHRSSLLRNEISKCSVGQNDATILFKNGSWIKSRTSTENSRSARANLLICDEFRMIDENILTTVLQQFLGTSRQPGYLDKPEYADLIEENKEIYMSSAWFKSSWAYKKAQGYTVNFFNEDLSYFICGLPYQLSLYERLRSKSWLQSVRSEPGYNEYTESMELECLWMGDDEGSLFQYDDLNQCRKIKNAYKPLKFYTDNKPVPKLVPNEKRILSVDVALMSSSNKKKNDASAIFINSLIQLTDTQYQSNIVYGETFEGLTTDELGLIIMRYFYEYRCTDLVLDCQGLGIGVFDILIKDQYDPQTGNTYHALNACNNDDMAERCKVHDAEKVIWCVKANASFNNDIAVGLRTGIQNGKINLLIDDKLAEEVLADNNKGYNKMTMPDKLALQNPYLQTTMAIFELIKLDSEVKNGQIKVKEQSNMRKDRYSSLAYNYWCACELERQLKPKNQSTEDLIQAFAIRKAKHF